jgi:hypothetical protein
VPTVVDTIAKSVSKQLLLSQLIDIYYSVTCQYIMVLLAIGVACHSGTLELQSDYAYLEKLLLNSE